MRMLRRELRNLPQEKSRIMLWVVKTSDTMEAAVVAMDIAPSAESGASMKTESSAYVLSTTGISASSPESSVRVPDHSRSNALAGGTVSAIVCQWLPLVSGSGGT